jgi:CubicO group peptidase (beta-lactamase class C family)
MKKGWLLGFLLVATGLFGESDSMDRVIEQFDVHVRDYFQKSQVPGMAIAVVSLDKIYYEKYFGVRERGKPEKVDEGTVFPIASCTKAFTSGIVAYVIGKGMLSWDDRVVDFEPGFLLRDPYVTCDFKVRDLLAHHSGMPAYTGDELFFCFNYGREEILKRLRYQVFIHDFRTVFGYQNFLVAVAGEVAGHAAGKSWKELVEKNIFQPLGMKKSFACYDDYMKQGNKVSNHFREMKDRREDKFTIKPLGSADVMAGAGVISSTVCDLMAWARLQLGEGVYQGKEVISPEALKETHKMQTIIEQKADEINGYALGWMVAFLNGQYVLSHEGAFDTGINTLVSLIPEKKVALIILTNSNPCSLTTALNEKFCELVMTGKDEKDSWQALQKKVDEYFAQEKPPFYEEKPKDFTAPLALSAYEGEYENDFYGKVKIEVQGENLVAYLGNNPTAYPLCHWNRDVFCDKEQKQEVAFTIEEQGKAGKVFFSGFSLDGRDGTFIRIEK